MTVIVNICGSPCSGKSTLACELFVKLKKNHKNCEYVSEYAKELVWAGDFETLNNQYYVTLKQDKMISAVDSKVDYIILDSPLIIGLFYNKYNKDNVSNVEKTKRMIESKIKETMDRSIYIFLKRDKSLEYMNSGRMHDSTESDDIEKGMRELLIENNINFTEITTGENIDNVMNLFP